MLERDGLGFAFPVPGMMMKHWTPEPLPAGLVAVRAHYEHALAAARTARRSSTPNGRAAADYWIGRLEFGIGYLDSVSALRQAATAERVGRKDDVVRQTELAHRGTRAAIEAYARVAGDQSDRGAIAILAEYVDRPLQKKLAALTRK